MKNKAAFIDKNDYPSVLSPNDIRNILGIGERQTYELLNSNPFPFVRVGRLIKVSKDIFIRWLEGEQFAR